MTNKSLLMTIAIMSIAISSAAQVTDTFTDSRDGEKYKTVKIGNQVWMAENLRATRYKDGTAIPLVTDKTEWSNLKTPAYCWYNNDEATFKATYGALYNWYAVNTGKLCPAGWHVATDAEWTTLTTYLGGEKVAGDKLKEAGTTYWQSPNGATNESGFSALPGGSRYSSNGSCSHMKGDGSWWTSTEHISTDLAGVRTKVALHRGMYFEYSGVYGFGYDERNGFSVRCLRD